MSLIDRYPRIGKLVLAEGNRLRLEPEQTLDRDGILLLVERRTPDDVRTAFGRGTLRYGDSGKLAHLLNHAHRPCKAALAAGAEVEVRFRDDPDPASAAFTVHEIVSRLGPAWNRVGAG